MAGQITGTHKKETSAEKEMPTAQEIGELLDNFEFAIVPTRFIRGILVDDGIITLSIQAPRDEQAIVFEGRRFSINE